jgi:hypothetical protein
VKTPWPFFVIVVPLVVFGVYGGMLYVAYIIGDIFGCAMHAIVGMSIAYVVAWWIDARAETKALAERQAERLTRGARPE